SGWLRNLSGESGILRKQRLPVFVKKGQGPGFLGNAHKDAFGGCLCQRLSRFGGPGHRGFRFRAPETCREGGGPNLKLDAEYPVGNGRQSEGAAAAVRVQIMLRLFQPADGEIGDPRFWRIQEALLRYVSKAVRRWIDRQRPGWSAGSASGICTVRA